MIQLTIFSDFACPASYATEAALWRIADMELDLRFRAFELHPQGGAVGTTGFGEQEWAAIQSLAAAEGIEIRPRAATPSTGKAHEAVHFARQHGLELELRREIFGALWASDIDIGRIDMLADLAARVGLDREDVRIALDIGSFEEAVRAEIELGRRLNIPGTPIVFVGTGREAAVVAGAQSQGEIRKVIEEWIKVERPAMDGM